jgi:predicted nuclease of restriction endonuclease-like (RecB) superfamily
MIMYSCLNARRVISEKEFILLQLQLSPQSDLTQDFQLMLSLMSVFLDLKEQVKYLENLINRVKKVV